MRRAARTSISGALLFGMTLFDSSGQRGIRRVIDVSGDGANNSGQLVVVARDEVVSKGITINGLPIMLKRPSYSTMDIELLDEYYEDCVIGGPAAFVVPVKDREKFVEAIRTKLVLEIARLEPRPAQGDEGLRRQSARALHRRRAALAGALGELITAEATKPLAPRSRRSVTSRNAPTISTCAVYLN